MQADRSSTPASWTRREFVRGAAGILAAPHLRGELAAEQSRLLVYVACGSGAISVFASDRKKAGDLWSARQHVPSPSPAFILHAPAQQALYVANEVAMYQGLPRGTVEAYRVDPVDGTLTLLGRTPLSLAATRPRHMALSPDGKWLAVAAYGGGIYNLLPVSADGALGAPRGIFKDVGYGPDAALQASAHPHTLRFDGRGQYLLASDFGSDRMSVFAVEDGRLIRTAQRSIGAGRGPGAFVLHPSGFVYTSHDLGKGIGCYRFDAGSGVLDGEMDGLTAGASAGSLALHPSGYALYTADQQRRILQVLKVDPRRGRLSQMQVLPLGRTAPSHVFVAPGGERVFLLDSRGGSILQCAAAPDTGELSPALTVAAVSSPRSIAVRAI